MSTRVMHLNGYPPEVQARILKNFFGKGAAKNREPSKIYVEIDKEIKRTGTSDPTITIDSTDLGNFTVTLTF